MTPTEELLVELMNAHGDSLKRTAFVMSGDLELSEDLTQETFIKFYKNHHNFRGESTYKTYLFRILINQIKMYHRQNKTLVNQKEFSPLYDQQVSFEDVLVSTIDLNKALSSLKEGYRNPIILYYYNDLSIEEVSTTLKLSISATKMRLKRGKKQLKQMLEKGGTL